MQKLDQSRSTEPHIYTVISVSQNTDIIYMHQVSSKYAKSQFIYHMPFTVIVALSY